MRALGASWHRHFGVLLAAGALILTASAARAEEAHPLTTMGMVLGDQACPAMPDGPMVPQFRQNDLARICFAEPVPPSIGADIKIGQLPATVGEATANSVLVALPQEPAAGDYVVSGTIGNSPITPFLIQFFPTPKPRLTDITPTSIPRGQPIRINGEGLSAPLNQIKVYFGDEPATVNDVAPDGTWVVTTLPQDSANSLGGVRPIAVSVGGVPASEPSSGLSVTVTQRVRLDLTAMIIGIALLPLLVVLLGVNYLFRSQKVGSNTARQLVAGLLYDDATQTYSLSRAQFYWWLLIIAFAYTFLFVGRGVTTGIWTLPPLNGILYTLLISTSTLLVANATSSLRGQKGSGALHPAPSDLIMHGGVIAPERIQQLLWTFLAGVAVVWMVVVTYATATSLPDIPAELLALMGLSSAAYITGKLVRAPGPIIRQVDLQSETGRLIVSGINLDRDASVSVNGVLLPKDKVKADPGQQLGSRLTLDPIAPTDRHTLPDSVVVLNSDGQRAEWSSNNAALAIAPVVAPTAPQPAAATATT